MIGKEWKQESEEGYTWNGLKGMEARKEEDKGSDQKRMEVRNGLWEWLERNGSKKGKWIKREGLVGESCLDQADRPTQ